MKARRHPRQGGHGLSLASGRDENRVLFIIILKLLNINQRVLRNVDIAQLAGRSDHVHHAAAFHHDLAAVLVRGADDLLHAVYIRGKRGHNDAVILMLCKNRVKRAPHRAFRHRKSRPDRVGAVAHQSQHALFPQLCKALQIRRLAEYRCVIDLEIACVDNNPGRRKDRQGRCVGDTVVCLHKFNAETP